MHGTLSIVTNLKAQQISVFIPHFSLIAALVCVCVCNLPVDQLQQSGSTVVLSLL